MDLGHAIIGGFAKIQMFNIHSSEGKLEPRAKGICTRYSEGVKGFRVWLFEDKKCVISRNVVFREAWFTRISSQTYS